MISVPFVLTDHFELGLSQTGYGYLSGAPNDDFLLNTLKTFFQAIQSSFRFLEIHSKRRYKLCIRSIILGHFESFRNFKGFSIIFPKVLDAVYRFTKVGIFLIPTSITFLSPKILYFLFLRKNSITTGVKCEKLGLENRREFIR